MKKRKSLPPNDEVRQRFGDNLRERRKQLGISQEELSFRAEIAYASVGLLELGKKLPRIDTFIRLAGALGVKPSELVAGIGWVPAEVVATPGGFDVPDDPELAAEVEELRRTVHTFRGRGSLR
ncbi:MAG TPA: helix-turn-helix transcriptional regulator [Solirubrobacterales bacterium]|nr:helix-turn-helix transcriptional regulator [Solirubrobacterales bacterium]